MKMSKNQQQPILQAYQLGDLQLSNRVVMSSLTRGRATNAALTPTALHAAYYAQRASAGLILTESAWVSENAIGFINLPGIYSQEQVKGWKLVTDAVHDKQGRSFYKSYIAVRLPIPTFLRAHYPKGPRRSIRRKKPLRRRGLKIP
jgi:N-ethylmaleimide reductase